MARPKRKNVSSSQQLGKPAKRTKRGQELDIKDEPLDENDPDAYEKMRLKNIEEKMKMLESMDLQQVKSDLRQVCNLSKVKKDPSRRGLKMKKERVFLEPRPRSLRLQGKNPDLSESSLSKATSSIYSVTEATEYVVPSGPLDFSKALRDGDDVELAENFSVGLREIKREPVEYSPPNSSTSLKTRLKNMKIDEKKVAKVVPSRIFSMIVHPAADRNLVFVGDKWGHLGMWDIHAENSQDGVYVYRPHSRPVNCLKFAPENTGLLYSLSYDGTIRRADLTKAVFDPVFEIPDDCNYSCSYFDFLSNNSVVVSLTRGCVAVRDFREPSDYKTYEVSGAPKAQKTVSVHPVDKNYFITNGTEGVITLWDARKLKSRGGSPLASLPGFKTTTSAFFSPVTGNRILATSLSDQIKIYRSEKMDSSVSLMTNFKHNNHTGRWLTTFKAAWLPQCEDAFIVGSMDQPRRIEIFSDRGQIVHALKGEELSSICSTITVHPSFNLIAGGNSSGRVYALTP